MLFIKNTTPSTLPDDELVKNYRSDKHLTVLSELYQRYMELVYGVCLQYFKDQEKAKDSVLMIYEELIEKLYRHDVQHFRPWLYQLARNHCLMILRSEKKMPMASLDVSLMQSVENVHLNGDLEKEENFKYMYHCLGLLIPEQKQVLELFYLESKCYNEIVEITSIEWNKVRSYIQNGRRNLKICMDKQMSDQ